MVKNIYLSYSACPESCWHIIRAIALGQPSVLSYCKDKKRVNTNRRHSTHKLKSSPFFDRDEYPFACSYEGGNGADVVYMTKSDNRRAGAIIGHQLLGCPNGTKFRIVIVY